jgi:hypothetical protein
MCQIQEPKIFPVDEQRSAIERSKEFLAASRLLVKLLDSFAFHYHDGATGFDLTLQSHLLVFGSRSWMEIRSERSGRWRKHPWA